MSAPDTKKTYKFRTQGSRSPGMFPYYGIFPRSVCKQLRRVAKDNDTSVAGVIREIIEEALGYVPVTKKQRRA
jgi:hypothetical protein